jgi:ATP-dependent Lon protease
VRTRLLCELDPVRRGLALEEVVREELGRARARDEFETKVDERVRRGFLEERLEVIRAELGESDPREAEADELELRIDAADFPPHARSRAATLLTRLRRVPTHTPEAARTRRALEWMLDLPWPAATDDDEPSDPEGDRQDYERARRVLAESHTALEDVKQRVLEYLAVRQLGGGSEGTVLCFLGPPGTGKSSMARAVADALGREFVHLPLGGLTEERELRGSPAEQDGGAPGLVLQGLARAGTPNPVVLLDELDKLQLGNSGAAAGPLMEVLDRDYNGEFLDHYLGVPFDLSRCVFLATANDVEEISEALLDRLEVIEFSGYTETEKLAIAREHLLPRAHARAGLEAWQLRLTPAAMRTLVRGYTEEVGVRQLQRLFYALARKAAVEVVRSGRGLYVRKSSLLELLGPALADGDLRIGEAKVGVATGLAWTSAGGALLPIEALRMPGGGRMILTGQLGDVLRECVQTAMSYVRSRLGTLTGGAQLEEFDFHLHFPSAATPVDGPSAGVPIATALVSLLSDSPVRHDLAMTGEISLHGDVLPVGGIREKLLAAVRAGMTEAIVPARNSQEVLRLPAEVRSKLTLHMIDHVDEAFALALVRSSGKRGGRRPA